MVSDDVIIITQDGDLGIGYYEFDEQKWIFQAEASPEKLRVMGIEWKWYYSPIIKEDFSAMEAKVADVKKLIEKYKGVFISELSKIKFEIRTINHKLPVAICDYVKTHFNVVGEERNVIVFKERKNHD